ncbi:hypothetical protein M405DRAFT_596364 [Rhizopogon salebrosus TDB-379]|nr:hypothetical protein M405DRAFT_596364 [Rhizopogon salebrosus TDB-379]
MPKTVLARTRPSTAPYSPFSFRPVLIRSPRGATRLQRGEEFQLGRSMFHRALAACIRGRSTNDVPAYPGRCSSSPLRSTPHAPPHVDCPRSRDGLTVNTVSSCWSFNTSDGALRRATRVPGGSLPSPSPEVGKLEAVKRSHNIGVL